MKEYGILFSGPMIRAIRDNRKWQTRRVAKRFRILLRQNVRADLSDFFPEARRTIARAGIHVATSNPHGALSVRAEDGKLLGIKPGEFDWVGEYGPRGRKLWVRETFFVNHTAHVHGPLPKTRPSYLASTDDLGIIYRADGDFDDHFEQADGPKVWRPSIFMSRWASRFDLEVTRVRCERLHAITPDDVDAEGVTREAVESLTGTKMGPKVNRLDLWRAGWIAINGEASWLENPFVNVYEFRRLT